MYNILQDKKHCFIFFKNYLESLLLTIILHFNENTVHIFQNICNQYNKLIHFCLPHEQKSRTESLTQTQGLQFEQGQALRLPTDKKKSLHINTENNVQMMAMVVIPFK